MHPLTRLCVIIFLIGYVFFGTAIASDPGTWYTKGGEYLEKGEYAAARDACRNAVSLDPEYLDAWIALAYTYAQSNMMDDAADAYQHALSIEPDNIPALKGIGYVYSRLGRDQEALNAFDHALRVNPDDPTSWLQKGLALSALGRMNESIPVYQKVIELSPGNFDAWLCMGLDYYSAGEYQEALDAFSHALESDERSGIAWQYKGDSLSHLGRYQEAIEAYERGLIVSPGNSDLLQGRDAAESALRNYLEGGGTTPSAPTEPGSGAYLPVFGIAAGGVIAAGVFLLLRRKRHKWMMLQEGVTPPSPDAGREHPLQGRVIEAGVHHDVFISYSSKDKTVADATCAYLESRGIRCWIAPRDVLPGSNYPRSIVEGINGSRVMVLIFSSHSNTSPHVVRELTHAVSRGVIILPFRIEDIQPSKDMEYLIGVPHWLDAMTPPLERHLAQLADTVTILLRQSDRSQQT